MYYAHTREGKPKDQWQLLVDHLTQTADLAGGFATKFNSGELGYILGLLHDLGKYSTNFQNRLEGSRERVDHSTAGMLQALTLYGDSLGKVLAYSICGHHGGLPDAGSEDSPGTLLERSKREPLDYNAYQQEIKPTDLTGYKLPLKLSEDIAFTFYFFIKMLFSCLVDADSLDTERFTEEEKANLRGSSASIHELLDLFEKHMQQITAEAEENQINTYRREILQNCISAAKSNPGMFTLTVPTGGGKTFSSMAFALNHARRHGMERIIYVIPYTSIIEQNAGIFRTMFGDKNVLEHHSNFQFEENDETQEMVQKIRLAADNWDLPIVATTSVQFFESLFASKRSKSRKLHNISNSIIVLDEAQMLPVKYLKPCLAALSELVHNYKSTVVLCTATQPNLNGLLPQEINVQEIVASPDSLYEKLRRTQILDLGEMDDQELVAELLEHPQALCIVNRREHAMRLYKELAKGGQSEGVYHLSTRMYPSHRKEVLAEIRERLKAVTPDGEPLECKVISTPLIEAGVDVDFPVVYRAMSGIDSIAQAAGRCNREGKAECADVYVFTPKEKHGQPPREIAVNVSTAKSVFRNVSDPLSLEGIHKYFELLYDVKNIDQKDIMKLIKERYKHLNFPFAEVAHRFKLIEANTIPVMVPVDDCTDLIKQIPYARSTYRLARKLQPYIVNLYDQEFKQLMETGGISVVDAQRGFYALSDMEKFYDDHTGIIKRDDFLFDVLIT